MTHFTQKACRDAHLILNLKRTGWYLYEYMDEILFHTAMSLVGDDSILWILVYLLLRQYKTQFLKESRWRRSRTGRSLSLLQIHRKNNRTVNKVYKTTFDR